MFKVNHNEHYEYKSLSPRELEQQSHIKSAKTAFAVTGALIGVQTAIPAVKYKDVLVPSLVNTLKGKDRYISNAAASAAKHMKETGRKVNLKQVKESAGKNYSIFPKTLKDFGKKYLKPAGESLATAAAVCTIITAVEMMITNKKYSKLENQE